MLKSLLRYVQNPLYTNQYEMLRSNDLENSSSYYRRKKKKKQKNEFCGITSWDGLE